MQDKIVSCFGTGCDEKFSCYQSPEDAKKAKHRNKQISKLLKQHHKEELKRLKILLLGKSCQYYREGLLERGTNLDHILLNKKTRQGRVRLA